MMNGPTIMIVDDAPVMRTMLRRILVMGGYQVVAEVAGATACLATYRTSVPEIVMMDILMPGKNGVDATVDLLHEAPGAKVVLCSLDKHESLIRAGLAAGARGFIRKPYRLEEVLGEMARVLGGESGALLSRRVSAFSRL